MSAQQVQGTIRPHLKATKVKLGGEARPCYIIDWAARDEELGLELSDMFGDGAPDDFAMGDDDTLIPIAILGMTSKDDGDGQPEGILLVDTADDGAVVQFDVDGTVILETRKVVAASVAALELR